MEESLDELYFTWLYGRVASVKTRDQERTYWSLFRQLYSKEFIWLIPNDDDRVEDGHELRYEFMGDREIQDIDPEWMSLGCSMLELLVGLSRRLAFEGGGRSRDWFWRLVRNAGLIYYSDAHYDEEAYHLVDDILETIIHRQYRPNGGGGLFPLTIAEQDQRTVEMRYQMSAYILENGGY